MFHRLGARRPDKRLARKRGQKLARSRANSRNQTLREASRGRLDGKTAVITGAGRGIGAVMAKHMASEGANVVVTNVLDTADTVAAIKGAGGSAIGMHVDVTSDESLAAMVETTMSEFGALNILVNNASIFAALQPKPFSRSTTMSLTRS